MKLNQVCSSNLSSEDTFAVNCVESCRTLLAALQKAKDAVVSEFSHRLSGNEHLLDLALNEADALAWETDYPQLVFPTLAAEKADAVARWHTRQRAVKRASAELLFA